MSKLRNMERIAAVLICNERASGGSRIIYEGRQRFCHGQELMSEGSIYESLPDLLRICLVLRHSNLGTGCWQYHHLRMCEWPGNGLISSKDTLQVFSDEVIIGLVLVSQGHKMIEDCSHLFNVLGGTSP